MSDITFAVIDMAGNITQITLPDDLSMPDVMNTIVANAHLPSQDSQGSPFNYRLFSRRLMRVLRLDGMLMGSGVLEDDQLRIVPAPKDRALEFEMLSDPEPGARLPIPTVSLLTIGRGSNNDIVIRAPIVSRQHGELIWQDGLHIFRDLNSANGSSVNTLMVTEPIPLSVGSVLKLGEIVQLRYQPLGATADISLSNENHIYEKVDTRYPTSLRPLPRAGIFVSLAPSDSEIGQPIVDELRQENFYVFWAIEIPPGTNAQEAIESSLTYSDLMVVILTPESANDSSLQNHWSRFVVDRKPILVLYESGCIIPNVLRDYPAIALEENATTVMTRVMPLMLDALR